MLGLCIERQRINVYMLRRSLSTYESTSPLSAKQGKVGGEAHYRIHTIYIPPNTQKTEKFFEIINQLVNLHFLSADVDNLSKFTN